MKKFPSGQAVFFPLDQGFWNLLDLRKHTVRAMLTDAQTQEYYITDEEMYLPGVLDRLQEESKQWDKEIKDFDKKAAGTKNGAYRCIALWNGSYQEGILVHQEKERMLCAYLPVITAADAQRDQALIRQLEGLAFFARNTKVYLYNKILYKSL